MATTALFPHLTSTGTPPSSREVADLYRREINKRYADGSLRPLVFPYHFYGYFLLVIYLCIPHTKRPLLYKARWLVLAVITAFQWRTLWITTSTSLATAFAVGLIAAYGVVWSVTWLVFYRPQFDLKRVESREVKGGQMKDGIVGDDGVRVETNGHAVGNGHVDTREAIGNGFAVATPHGDGNVRQRILAHGYGKEHVEAGKLEDEKDDTQKAEIEYYWQSYPDNLIDRIAWVLDLIINFRLPGWNVAIPPLPSPPPYIELSLGEPVSESSKSGVSYVGLKRFDTRRDLFRARILKFVVGYFLLDIFKTTMIKDPYFLFGPTTYALPNYLQGFSPRELQFIRNFLGSCAIITSLETVFLLAPLLFSVVLGPNLLGLRAEPWYYSTTWGSFSMILTKGLNGLWGSWWHQTFRFVFAAPTNFLITNGYTDPRSRTTKLLGLVFAFGISGILHSAGSISHFPRTYPWHAPVFFMLQALGIFIQTMACSILHPYIKKLPEGMRKSGNLLFTLMWLFYTGWWLADDFARGGMWLYEPIPFSLLRGLGFGDKGDGWWCWGHIGVGWYRGNHWWDSGVAI